MSARDRRAGATSAIYGTIVVTAVIAALSEDPRAGPGELLAAAIDTAIVFWVAQVYAAYVGERAASTERAAWQSFGELLAREIPMVAAAGPPAAALALGALDLVSRESAVTLALGAGVVELFVWGLAAGWHERFGAGRAVLVGLANAALGLLMVFLKVLVH